MTARKNPLIDSRTILKLRCPRGHAYDAKNTRFRKSGGARKGNRYCGECNRLWASEGYRQRQIADPEGERAKRKQRTDRWRKNPENSVTLRQARRDWYLQNKEWSRVRAVMHRYGLTLDQYHAIQERDDFSCRICGTDENIGIDHDHSTGRVRHLLCDGCNAGIGHFRENPDRLRAAATYVETRC